MTVRAVDTGGQRRSTIVHRQRRSRQRHAGRGGRHGRDERRRRTVSIDVLANDTHGDDPTIIVSAGSDSEDSGEPYPDSSESTPTSVLNETGRRNAAERVAGHHGNSIEYTPKQDFNGTDSFNYTIRDADGQTSTANVTITSIRSTTRRCSRAPSTTRWCRAIPQHPRGGRHREPRLRRGHRPDHGDSGHCA